MDIEQLIKELNDPKNQSLPETIDEIQKQIQRRQREPSAWQLGLDLLSNDEAVMRFYGALTLTIKINADWDTDKVGDDRNLISHLLENLVSSYVRLSSLPDAAFVLQKLSTTLVALFQKPQTAWALPIRHLAACTIANRYISQDHVPELCALMQSEGVISGHQLRSLFLFAATLAEQENAISGSVREQHVRVRMSNNLADIWRLLHFCTISLDGSSWGNSTDGNMPYKLLVRSQSTESLDLAKVMLQVVTLWANEVKPKSSTKDTTIPVSTFDFFEATMKSFARLFNEEALAPSVLQTLTTLEESSHGLLQRAIPGYAEYIIKSPQATLWVEQLTAGDFDPDAVAYMNYLEAAMNQVDVTSPDYLGNGACVEMLNQIERLVKCDGVAGIEDPVCQVALEILTSVVEGYGDWPESSPHQDSMKELVKRACGSVLEKIQMPSEELSIKTRTWDTDDRAKFQDFRYDVQDFLHDAFGILGEALIEEIVNIVVTMDTATEWNVFEAGLFCLTAFSDTLANEAEKFDKYLMDAFGCARWRSSVQAELEVPERVRRIIIKVISENTGFLQRHTEFLVSSLNFLFTSLHMESSATAASRAIYTLCDTQRSMLIEALPQFMSSLNDASDVEPDARHRIYAAVGAIVQALPTEEAKVEPILQVLQQLQNASSTLAAQPNQDELSTRSVDILQTMGALSRGLRAPSDAPVDLEMPRNHQSLFWIQGDGSQIQQKALQIYTDLLQSTNGQQDPLFVEAACDFIRAGFTEEHPSPFKFPNAKIPELLWVYMQLGCPQPDHIMSTASGYLASVDTTDPANEFHTLITMSIHSINNAVSAFKSQTTSVDSDFCAATLDFYNRLLPKWAPTLFSLPEAHDTVSLVIELALALTADSDTLPRRAGASFLTALFEASAQPALTSPPPSSSSTTPTPPASTMASILQTFAPRIIATVTHLLAGVCARSDIDALTETLKKAVSRQPLLTTRLLKEAVKDENHVLSPKALAATKPEQRARFASQVEMLRGQRRTNEVVREFWIACRGSGFGYVT